MQGVLKGVKSLDNSIDNLIPEEEKTLYCTSKIATRTVLIKAFDVGGGCLEKGGKRGR